MDHDWLFRSIPSLAIAVNRKAGILMNCFGVIDGTVRAICRPKLNQEVVFNGHKRVHSLKFQSVTLPNGIIAEMIGPSEGKQHDAGILYETSLPHETQNHAILKNFCMYGDQAYPLRPWLVCPYNIYICLFTISIHVSFYNRITFTI